MFRRAVPSTLVLTAILSTDVTAFTVRHSSVRPLPVVTSFPNGSSLSSVSLTASTLRQIHNRRQCSKSDDDEGQEADKKSSCIYMDYNGTTPIHPDVLKAMLPYLTEHFGNPGASHYYGTQPRLAIAQARREILDLLGVMSISDGIDDEKLDKIRLESLWFTGCGTESDNLAIELAIRASSKTATGKKHIVTCNVEHPAVEMYLKHLQSEGVVDVTFVPVQTNGCVLAADVIAALKDDTILVTLMLANNESGALQPVAQVAEECHRRNILIHTDAAQAVGKVSCDVADLGHPDLISVVGHKMGAPKGVAALYVRPGCLETKRRGNNNNNDTDDKNSTDKNGVMLIGGGQEFGRRAGTENTPYIVGMGKAAQLAKENLANNVAVRMEDMRQRLLKKLQTKLSDDIVRPNGPVEPSLRLPNTLSVGIQNVNAADLLSNIGHVVAASAGATCHSETASISSVLRAMQVPDDYARGTLRLSLGPSTTVEEVDRASQIIVEAVEQQWERNNNIPSSYSRRESST